VAFRNPSPLAPVVLGDTCTERDLSPAPVLRSDPGASKSTPRIPWAASSKSEMIHPVGQQAENPMLLCV